MRCEYREREKKTESHNNKTLKYTPIRPTGVLLGKKSLSIELDVTLTQITHQTFLQGNTYSDSNGTVQQQRSSPTNNCQECFGEHFQPSVTAFCEIATKKLLCFCVSKYRFVSNRKYIFVRSIGFVYDEQGGVTNQGKQHFKRLSNCCNFTQTVIFY